MLSRYVSSWYHRENSYTTHIIQLHTLPPSISVSSATIAAAVHEELPSTTSKTNVANKSLKLCFPFVRILKVVSYNVIVCQTVMYKNRETKRDGVEIS